MQIEDKRISLKIDLHSGTIELDAPAENFEHAIEKTKELTKSLDLRKPDSVASERATREAADTKVSSQSASVATAPEKARSKPGKVVSSGRPGRLGSFNPESDLLNEQQQRAIREFRSSKLPADHADEVLVALYEGSKLLNRQAFNYNQIYTLMWRAGASPLPKALDEVLRLLMQQQLVEKNETGYFLKFLGQERVETALPRKKEQ